MATAAVLRESSLLSTESYDPSQSEISRFVSESLQHTDHMEAALASTGPQLASLQRDVIPELEANSARLEDLFAALDLMRDRVLPDVETSIGRMESAMEKLEKEQKSLDPSSITKMLSFFGSSSSAPLPPRDPFQPVEVFSAAEMMAVLTSSGGRASEADATFPGETKTDGHIGVLVDAGRFGPATEEGITGVGYEVVGADVSAEAKSNSQHNESSRGTLENVDTHSDQDEDEDSDIEI